MLAEVTVTASRMAVETAAAPARVVVFDAEAIEAAAARSVAELLARRSTAFIRSYGAGGLSSVSLRGTTPSQTLVLLDGYRLSDPQLGQLDLSLLPTLLLGSVEVMHGAGSALYGSDALGGVIHLRTNHEAPALHLFGGAGAFGERTVSGIGTAQARGLRWAAAADVRATDGDYAYLDRSLIPARSVQRTGWESRRLSLFGNVGGENWQVAAWYADAERGLGARPGEAGADQWDEHLRLWGQYEQRFGWGTLRTGGLVQRAALRYRHSGIALDETGRTTLASADVQADVLAGSHWLLSGGFSGGLARADHPSLASDAEEAHVAAFATGMGSYGPLLLYPTLRLDTYLRASPLTAISPRLGANLRLRPGLRLKAQLASAFGAPTLNDRFWQPGGNPDLRPERALAADLGFFAEGTLSALEVTGYVHFVRNQLTWLPRAGTVWSPENTRRVRTWGAEATYRHRWRFLQTDLALAYTDARDRSAPDAPTFNRQLRYVPRWLVRSALSADLTPFRFDVSARYTGRRYVTADESQSLPPFFLLDVHVRYAGTLGPVGFTLGAHLENVLNTEYAVVSGYPMPPRHARLYLLFEL